MRHRFAIEEILTAPGGSVATTYADSANLDAFSRLRTSNPENVFDVQNQYGIEATQIETGNSGTGVAPSFGANTRLIILQVGIGGAGGTSWAQSFEYIPYQPGKSQLVFMTGVMGPAVAGAVMRFGYGDDNNGIFYEKNGTGGVQFNRRTYVSGAVVNNPVVQADWNLDRLDGTGPSGVLLDTEKCFILIIDLQFLGMGRVRIGFDIDGVIRYAHEFRNANVLTTTYMQTATLPVRAEIIASAAIASTANAYFKCASVCSEGGFEISQGLDFTAEGTGTAPTAAPGSNILSLQPLTTFNGYTTRGLFVPESLEIYGGTNPIRYWVYYGVTWAVEPAWASVNATYSFMQYATGAGTTPSIASAIAAFSGYLPSGASSRGLHSEDLGLRYPVTLNKAGAVRALGRISIFMQSLAVAASTDNRVTLNWREVR